MGASAAVQPSKSAPPPAPLQGSVTEEWEARCERETFARWPLSLYETLFRALDGDGAAVAICFHVVNLTHGSVRRKDGKPARKADGGIKAEWTADLLPEYFADTLALTLRTAQEKIRVLVESGCLGERPGKGRAKQYQAQPWVWESIDRQRAGKRPPDEPDNNEHSENDAPRVRIIDEPLVVRPGKRSRPIPLSDELKASLKTFRCENLTGFEFHFQPFIAGTDLCLAVSAPEASSKPATEKQTPNPTAAANPKRHPFDVVSVSLGDDSPLAKEGRTPTQNSASRKTEPTENAQAAIAILRAKCRKHWNHGPDKSIESQVIAKLGDAPAAGFGEYIDTEVKAAMRKQRGARPILLVALAEQFREKWEALEESMQAELVDPVPVSNDSADPFEATREFARLDPDGYEAMRTQRMRELGETDWPTLEELGIEAPR